MRQQFVAKELTKNGSCSSTSMHTRHLNQGGMSRMC